MGNLFYHGVSPTEIKGMSFAELSFWDSWDEAFRKAEAQPQDKRGAVTVKSHAREFRKKVNRA